MELTKHQRLVRTLAENNKARKMTRKVDTYEYEALESCIKSDQVPAKEIAEFNKSGSNDAKTVVKDKTSIFENQNTKEELDIIIKSDVQGSSEALKNAINRSSIEVREFTVAPQINPKSGLPFHDWLIDFKTPPPKIKEFSMILDAEMRKQNTYYDDLIKGKILRPSIISPVVDHGFESYMKKIGKLGGQNKVPRLSNDRNIADKLSLEINYE